MENFDNKLYFYKAKCLNIVDGDTIDVELNLGMHIVLKERLRLFGINSNEIFGVKIGSPGYEAGIKCRDKVIELILNKPIWINTIKDKQEKYGRFLAIVFFIDQNGQYINLNDLLVSEGLAKTASY